MTYNEVEGWCDPHIYQLYDEVAKNYEGAFVEVGSYLGASATFLATKIQEYNKNAKIYCVDIWETSFAPEHFEGILKKYSKNSLLEIFNNNVKECGFESVITPIQSTSMSALAQFEDNSLDFIFIDGDHSYEAVYEDTLNWYPKLKEGRIISGHDAYAPQIQKAVTDALGKYNKTFSIDGTIWKCLK